MAVGPNKSISTIILPCIDDAAVLPPPDIIVPYFDLSGDVIVPPYVSFGIVLEVTFLDSLKNAWVFLDLSLILLNSSVYSAFFIASLDINPYIL